jgi:hypothetical protein
MSSPALGWWRLLGLFPREQGKAHLLPDLGVVARGRLAVMVPQQRQRQRLRGGSILTVR